MTAAKPANSKNSTMPFRLPESMPEQGSSRVTHLHRDINRRIVDANSVVKVLNIVEANSQDFNAVNISTAFHRLARMWRDLPDNNNGSSNGSSNGQTRLDTTLHKLMQLAVRRIKEVGGYSCCIHENHKVVVHEITRLWCMKITRLWCMGGEGGGWVWHL